MYPYRAYLWHILFPVMIILVSAMIAVWFPSNVMIVAFISITLICVVAGIWIAIAGVLEKYSDYWESIGRDIDKLQKTPPELWGTLGFVTPPNHVTVTQNVTGEPGESSYYASKTFSLNLSAERMQVLADALLTGSKTLSEGDWVNTIIGQTKIREVKHDMLRAGLIRQRNPRNKTSGFILTERGVTYLYQYASEWVKADSSLDVMLSRVTTPPLEA